MNKLNPQKGFVIPLVIAIIVVILIGGGVYFANKNKTVPINVETVATTTSNNDGQLRSTSPDSSVSGMSQYTDSNIGFSFWYPSTWQVMKVAVQNQNKYPGGTITQQLNVTNGHRVITIEDFSSPTFSITDSTGVGACPVCMTVHYYLDLSQHAWMAVYPNGTESGRTAAGVPVAANVSSNTMGGLHMLAGSMRFGGNVIIPLSAQNFVVVSVDGAIATESDDDQALAKTIVAADSSVATPVNADQQVQIIQAEKKAYLSLNGLNDSATTSNSDWKTYTDNTYGFSFQYPTQKFALFPAASVVPSYGISGMGVASMKLIFTSKVSALGKPGCMYGESGKTYVCSVEGEEGIGFIPENDSVANLTAKLEPSLKKSVNLAGKQVIEWSEGVEGSGIDYYYVPLSPSMGVPHTLVVTRDYTYGGSMDEQTFISVLGTLVIK